MNISLIAFTEKGIKLAERIAEAFEGSAVLSGRDVDRKLWAEAEFRDSDALVFVGACGIAVRTIAPHIRHKSEDPAVIVIDELGNFVIPILSGHLGGANELASEISEFLGATPVITTATDINGVFAVDTWAKKNGMKVLNPEKIKHVSSKALRGEKIYIRSDFDIIGEVPEGVELSTSKNPDVVITYRRTDEEALVLVPRILSIGLGCRRGVSKGIISEMFERFIEEAGIYADAVVEAASIDIKKDEQGILDFTDERGLGLKVFSAEELSTLEGEFSSSDFVRSTVGVDNVCERSALMSSGAEGKIIKRKFAGNGVTMALAEKDFHPDWKRR